MRGEATLPSLLRDAAGAHPESIAVAVDGVDRLRYGTWEERSDRLANGLHAQGLLPRDRVALIFDAARWCGYAVAYLAAHKVGAVPLLLPAGAGEPTLRRALEEIRPAAVLAPEGLAPAQDRVPVLGSGELEAAGRGHSPSLLAHVSDLAEILTVLRPLSRLRTVTRRSEDVLAAVAWMDAAPDGPPALLHSFAPGTVAGQDPLYAALAASTPSIVLPTFHADRLCALLAARRIRMCALQPGTAQALLDSGAGDRHDLTGVARVLLASGGAPPALLMGLAAAFPNAALVTVDVLGQGGGTRVVHDRSRPGALGRPRGHTPVWVADDAGRPIPTGVVGQVRVGVGDAAQHGGAARGFLDADGFLYTVTGGRDVIHRHGSPIPKQEVETALCAHPAVADSAALGSPDDGSATSLVAAVALDSPVPAQELQAWVGARLADDRVPDEIMVVDALPRNATGVLLTGELRHHLGLGRPASAPRTAPTPVEKAVAATWRRVLGLRDVGFDDDFFELGGSPFAAVHVLDLLDDALGVRLPLDAALQAPTVSGLAAEFERRSAPDPATGPAPVAFSQEGMIWHEVFAPGCQNLPGLARRYRGLLDVGALDRALDEIVRRHEPLRTTFELRGGRLLQTVRPHQRTHLAIQDLRDLPPAEGEEEVARRVTEAGQRPFDLARDAVFAPVLLRLADDDHVLVIRTHHSVFDDWSVGIFRRELAALYTSFTRGEVSTLPEPLRFTDFARAQRRDLAGPAGTREMAFWRRELDGAPFTAQLPVDDPARASGSPQTAGQPVSLELPPDLHQGLRGLARGQRATVFMTMLATYAVLVHRYTGQDDLLLATVVANRNRTELEGMIGCFTKKVPLRLRVGGDPPFVEMLARTRAALLGALTHQDLPFEAVVQDVLGAPAATHGLIPHVALMFQGETPRRELVLPGVDSAGFETATTARRAHFIAGDNQPPDDQDRVEPWGAGLYRGTFVILSVAESEDRLSCVARGAFHGPAVRRLLETYRTLLEDVVAGPTRPVSELALMDGPGQAEAVARGRGRAESVPSHTLHATFDARVRRHPDAVAVNAGGRTVTYAELGARADRLATRLQAIGVAPGATVGLALGPVPDAVAAAFAVWKTGAAWVGLDPGDVGDRVARILARTSAQVVIGTDPRGTIAPHAQLVAIDDDSPSRAHEPTPSTVGPEATAVVFYGAGASAVPHGVALDHRGVLALAAGLRDLYGQPHSGVETRRVCLSAPPTGDGFLRQLSALLDGHTLCVPDRPLTTDPTSTVTLLESGHADVLDCTPADLTSLVDADLRSALARRNPTAAEPTLVVGTRGPVHPATWATVRSLAGTRVLLLYGPAECAFGATAARVADVARAVVGHPLAGVQAHVLDAHGQPVPAQASGELHLGGPGLTTGYLDGAQDEQGRFVDRVLDGTATRLYRTGQRARRLPDATIELLGAVDADTDLRGFAVDLARMQSTLAACPGVGDVAVTMHRDDRGEPRLVAHITPDERPPTLAELRAHVWARLPGYAWPAAMVVVGGGSAGRDTIGDGASAHAAALTALWAGVLGAGWVASGENYWQRFTFLEVLARAREAGLAVTDEHITRNRTVEMLATDVATRRPPSNHPA